MVTFKEIMERDMPEQTIFIGDVVRFHKNLPLGVVVATETWQGFRLLTIAYRGDNIPKIFNRVRQESCKLIGRNYKEQKESLKLSVKTLDITFYLLYTIFIESTTEK